MRKIIFAGLLFVAISFVMIWFFYHPKKNDKKDTPSNVSGFNKNWIAPDTSQIAHNPEGDMIRYGRTLIVHTSDFFGPHGSIKHISNGMNCENCHADAGTKFWGNNFSMVASVYPLFRNRSGKLETVEMRINDCFDRSLNGQSPGNSSREMNAMIAYIKWVGKDVSKAIKPKGAGSEALPFLLRAADTAKGKIVYVSVCAKCHGEAGEGILQDNLKEYLYPPLWGKHSYNTGAGIYELSKFAGYIKNNMPFGTNYKKPFLSDEQAWDVAAYVNSRARPVKDVKMDWPDLFTKPFDYPFGPYADSFSVLQHKYGPFEPIRKFYTNRKKSTEKIFRFSFIFFNNSKIFYHEKDDYNNSNISFIFSFFSCSKS